MNWVRPVNVAPFAVQRGRCQSPVFTLLPPKESDRSVVAPVMVVVVGIEEVVEDVVDDVVVVVVVVGVPIVTRVVPVYTMLFAASISLTQ